VVFKSGPDVGPGPVGSLGLLLTTEEEVMLPGRY
jgi:hypothetical protein